MPMKDIGSRAEVYNEKAHETKDGLRKENLERVVTREELGGGRTKQTTRYFGPFTKNLRENVPDEYNRKGKKCRNGYRREGEMCVRHADKEHILRAKRGKARQKSGKKYDKVRSYGPRYMVAKGLAKQTPMGSTQEMLYKSDATDPFAYGKGRYVRYDDYEPTPSRDDWRRAVKEWKKRHPNQNPPKSSSPKAYSSYVKKVLKIMKGLPKRPQKQKREPSKKQLAWREAVRQMKGIPEQGTDDYHTLISIYNKVHHDLLNEKTEEALGAFMNPGHTHKKGDEASSAERESSTHEGAADSGFENSTREVPCEQDRENMNLEQLQALADKLGLSITNSNNEYLKIPGLKGRITRHCREQRFS